MGEMPCGGGDSRCEHAKRPPRRRTSGSREGGGLWRAAAADVSREIFVCRCLAFKTPLVKQNTRGAESTPWLASSHITMRCGRPRGWRKNRSRTHLSCPLPPQSSRLRMLILTNKTLQGEQKANMNSLSSYAASAHGGEGYSIGMSV